MTPHARMVAAVDALIDRRSMDPLAHLDVVSSAEFFALVAVDDSPAPRHPDWIDARMTASSAWFTYPLATRAARRLYAAQMRRREVARA